jgi:hypothetical protein
LFRQLICRPFHHRLVVVLSVPAALTAVAAIASLLRGGRYIPDDADQATSLARSLTAPAGASDTTWENS